MRNPIQNRAQPPSHLRYRLTKKDLVELSVPEYTIWPGGYDWDCRVETCPAALPGAAGSRVAVMDRRVSRNAGTWLVSTSHDHVRLCPHDMQNRT